MSTFMLMLNVVYLVAGALWFALCGVGVVIILTYMIKGRKKNEN